MPLPPPAVPPVWWPGERMGCDFTPLVTISQRHLCLCPKIAVWTGWQILDICPNHTHGPFPRHASPAPGLVQVSNQDWPAMLSLLAPKIHTQEKSPEKLLKKSPLRRAQGTCPAPWGRHGPPASCPAPPPRCSAASTPPPDACAPPPRSSLPNNWESLSRCPVLWILPTDPRASQKHSIDQALVWRTPLSPLVFCHSLQHKIGRTGKTEDCWQVQLIFHCLHCSHQFQV